MASQSLLVGSSPAMARLRAHAERILAVSGASGRLPPILLLGETGSGKGHLARYLHQHGPRADQPFVEQNCANLPETLVESELFGHERGAFTDARQAKAGLFQLAHRGVLFLDEIGTVSPAVQAKLLTVIEEQRVRRVGGVRSEPVDVWIVSATNEDLEEAQAKGRFRADLYHRLSGLTLRMPPLRERGDDVLELAEHVLAAVCREYERPPRTLAASARAALLRHPWPGNVRELAYLIRRAALLADTDEITVDDLGLPPPPTETAGAVKRRDASTLAGAAASDDPQAILAALEETQWNLSRTAARLGLPRNTLRYRMERLDIRRGGGSRPAATAPSTSVPPAALGAPLRWERRSLTALRVRLQAPMDVALGRGAPVLQEAIETARGFGAHVSDLHPRGVTALFGGLEPLEDGPVRATLAALVVLRAADRVNARDAELLDVRCAVHTGECLVARGAGVPGMDPAEADRMTATLDGLLDAGPPLRVLVSPATARQVQRRFELEPLPGGSAGFGVVGRGRSGFEVDGRTWSRFVGRDRELATLDDLLAEAEHGRGQVVSVLGEPGVGKSRLLHEFRRSLGPERVTYVEGRCASHGVGIPYLPIIDVVRASFGLAEADPPALLGDKTRAGLQALGLPAGELAPYLLHLLAVRDAASEQLARSSPEAVRTRAVDVLRQIAVAASQQRPLVLTIEDVHWIDQTSTEGLAALVESIPACRILVIVTSRQGLQVPWLGRSYATQIVLRPLTRTDSFTVLASLWAGWSPQPDVAERIVARADGIPFFLEELGRAVAEARDVGTTAAMPETIQSAVAARVDRLPETARHVLQAAAVIGKDGLVSILREVAAQTDDVFRDALAVLRAGEFLHEARIVPAPEYTFKHALTQEVAYRGLPVDRRQALHAAVAAAILSQIGEAAARVPEVLARHYTEAGSIESAIVMWQRAGELAIRRSANVEAVTHLTQGLALIERLPEGAEPISTELALRLALGTALAATRGYAAPEIAATLERAHRLVERLGETPHLFPVRFGLWRFAASRAELATAADLVSRLLEMAARSGEPGEAVAAHVVAGITAFYLGRFDEAREHLERSLERQTPALAQAQRAAYGQDLGVGARGYLGWTLAVMGRLDAGAAAVDAAVTAAREQEHAVSLALALLLAGFTRHLRREPARVAAIGDELVTLSRDQHLTYFTGVGLYFTGWARVHGGALAAGLEVMREGFQVSQTVNQRIGVAHRAQFAETLLQAGADAEALAVLDESVAHSQATGDSAYLAEIYRVRARALTRRGAIDEARRQLVAAVDLAARQGARTLALRAAVQLVELAPGGAVDPADLARLAAIEAGLEEGKDLDDRVAARRLLARGHPFPLAPRE